MTTKCNCPACDRSSVIPLSRDKWLVGQRVIETWHSPERRPIDYTGIIADKSWSPPVNLIDGVMVQWDNGAISWHWDFMIENGIGYGSPLREESK